MATEMVLVPKKRYERLSDKDKEYGDKVSYYTTLLRENGINFTEPKTGEVDSAVSNANSDTVRSASYDKEQTKQANVVKYSSPMNIKEQLPRKYHLYGKRLLEYIKKHGRNMLGWDEKGVIIYRGRVIAKTAIIELIKYIFDSKGKPPTGIKDFRRGLKEIRTPKVFFKPDLLQPPGIPIDVKKNWRKY